MRKFKPGKAMTVFVVFFFPVLLVLGAWQVNRGIEKQEICIRSRLLVLLIEIKLREVSRRF